MEKDTQSTVCLSGNMPLGIFRFCILAVEDLNLSGPSCLHRLQLYVLLINPCESGGRHHKSPLKIISRLGRTETSGKNLGASCWDTTSDQNSELQIFYLDLPCLQHRPELHNNTDFSITIQKLVNLKARSFSKNSLSVLTKVTPRWHLKCIGF